MSSLAAAATATDQGLNLLRFIPGYTTHIATTGKEPLILLLLAFLITFGLTRLYTRLARIYGWGRGSVHGVHLHHMVIGIIIVLVAGVLAIATSAGSPWIELLAIAFGIGAALTLDEFALWLYFRDVYWTEEGRSSIDATLMGTAFAALLLVGTSPFGAEQVEHEFRRTIAFGIISFNALLALVTFLKGRLMLGLISIFLPPVGLVCALRLAKPHSPWARWFYDDAEVARSHQRFDEHDRRLEALKRRFYDLIGGAPSDKARMQPPVDVVGGYLTGRDQPPAGAAVDRSQAGR
jgi:hypothetical protein